MGYADGMRRAAGWFFLAVVAVLISMGYHFGNVRFAPIAVGFAIMAGICLMERRTEQVRSNAIHPGADTGVG
jgi:hypothetical protein